MRKSSALFQTLRLVAPSHTLRPWLTQPADAFPGSPSRCMSLVGVLSIHFYLAEPVCLRKPYRADVSTTKFDGGEADDFVPGSTISESSPTASKLTNIRSSTKLLAQHVRRQHRQPHKGSCKASRAGFAVRRHQLVWRQRRNKGKILCIVEGAYDLSRSILCPTQSRLESPKSSVNCHKTIWS